MFKSEDQLVRKLKKNYTQLCYWDVSKYSTCIMQEVDLGFGVADLVISQLKPDTFDNRSELSYFDITVYKIIEEANQLTLHDIQIITKANSNSIKKSLNKLIIESFVKQDDQLYQIRKRYKSINTTSVAIEAKLKNWKRALDQAFRYKWFASKSYVILDSKHIQPALANIEHFKKLNVGLAEIGKNGVIIEYYNPKKQKPIDEKMSILLSEYIINRSF